MNTIQPMTAPGSSKVPLDRWGLTFILLTVLISGPLHCSCYRSCHLGACPWDLLVQCLSHCKRNSESFHPCSVDHLAVPLGPEDDVLLFHLFLGLDAVDHGVAPSVECDCQKGIDGGNKDSCNEALDLGATAHWWYSLRRVSLRR